MLDIATKYRPPAAFDIGLLLGFASRLCLVDRPRQLLHPSGPFTKEQQRFTANMLQLIVVITAVIAITTQHPSLREYCCLLLRIGYRKHWLAKFKMVHTRKEINLYSFGD